MNVSLCRCHSQLVLFQLNKYLLTSCCLPGVRAYQKLKPVLPLERGPLPHILFLKKKWSWGQGVSWAHQGCRHSQHGTCHLRIALRLTCLGPVRKEGMLELSSVRRPRTMPGVCVLHGWVGRQVGSDGIMREPVLCEEILDPGKMGSGPPCRPHMPHTPPPRL